MSDNPPNYAIYTPQRAMVIVAHPDDIEFGVAGTIARWTRASAKVCYVLCTDGDAGFTDPSITRQRAAEIRRAEQTEAARIVGVEEVIFLGHPDGLLFNTLELRRQLVREIRRFKPDTIITQHPTQVFAGTTYINHPDHRAAGQAALDATFPAAIMPQVFPEFEAEGLTPHRVRHVFVRTWEEANVFIDITQTIDLKICALQAHDSQVGGRDIGKRIRDWAAENGKAAGLTYAESFFVVTLPGDHPQTDIRSQETGEPCEEAETNSPPAVKRYAAASD
jgi:LmbE family N-acetylglucosaminyl deacetylase